MDQFDQIKKLEIELTSSETRKNAARLNELIDDSFEEFGSSGRSFCKKDILEMLPNEEQVQIELLDFEYELLGENCVLVKYKSTSNNGAAFRSSIWRNNNGVWQMLHHQATKVQDAF